MTCKEAVKSLKNIAILGTEKAIEDGMEAIGVAIEALEKQIAKKPIAVSTKDGEFIAESCPTCKTVVFSLDKHMHCKWCGQKFDRSEVE